jgi:hypothetical protein
VSHAHLPIKHLIRKIELRGPKPSRDIRPQWMAGFVDCLAELFEPFTEVGRVGFECAPATDERWEISMYIGCNEVVGGRDDGRKLAVDFQFDIAPMLELFEKVTLLRWNVFSTTSDAFGDNRPTADRSFLMVEGVYSQTNIRLQIFSQPPAEAGPGLRYHTDGSWEAV